MWLPSYILGSATAKVWAITPKNITDTSEESKGPSTKEIVCSFSCLDSGFGFREKFNNRYDVRLPKARDG